MNRHFVWSWTQMASLMNVCNEIYSFRRNLFRIFFFLFAFAPCYSYCLRIHVLFHDDIWGDCKNKIKREIFFWNVCSDCVKVHFYGHFFFLIMGEMVLFRNIRILRDLRFNCGKENFKLIIENMKKIGK